MVAARRNARAFVFPSVSMFGHKSLTHSPQHELFLARCPMMTPFTAQLALAAAPLQQFIALSKDERIARNPWISPRVLVRISASLLSCKLVSLTRDCRSSSMHL
jgi:hypothetical protein